MKPIPEWLAPHKNSWLTAGKMSDLVSIEGRAFLPWLESIKPRLREITETSRNRTGVVRRYLVKQVWACALAHGYNLLPNPKSHGPTIVENLEKQLFAMSIRATNAAHALNVELMKQAAPIQAREREVEAAMGVDLLKMLVAATEPRPAQGVYFLLDQLGEVVYIGQSVNVLTRMSGHRDKGFVSVKMVPTNDENRLELEGRFIEAFRPRLNIKMNEETYLKNLEACMNA